MIPIYSRYRWSDSILDANQQTSLSLRATLDYAPYADNRVHIVQDGETLEGLADRYLSGLDNPPLMYWAIADFQPDPILDPTLQLTAGTMLIIPSMATVQSFLLSVGENNMAQE